ncbi:hypothetical protein L6R52_32190 [Myxococcota bacterium]|nr:hypothetical protein [Myxococcota bacterium]
MGDLATTLQALELRSAAIGFALGLGVSLVLMIGLKLGKLMLKVALLVAIVSLFGGAYLGWR